VGSCRPRPWRGTAQAVQETPRPQEGLARGGAPRHRLHARAGHPEPRGTRSCRALNTPVGSRRPRPCRGTAQAAQETPRPQEGLAELRGERRARGPPGGRARARRARGPGRCGRGARGSRPPAGGARSCSRRRRPRRGTRGPPARRPASRRGGCRARGAMPSPTAGWMLQTTGTSRCHRSPLRRIARMPRPCLPPRRPVTLPKEYMQTAT